MEDMLQKLWSRQVEQIQQDQFRKLKVDVEALKQQMRLIGQATQS